uniref:Uncharacterized protein n=1 Tax=Anguilla anguilla TaxID=7936 RepID=A0A0E9WLL0_ANGAN
MELLEMPIIIDVQQYISGLHWCFPVCYVWSIYTRCTYKLFCNIGAKYPCF